MVDMGTLTVETPSLDAEDYLAMGRIHVTAWQAAYADIIPANHLASLSIDGRQAFWRSKLQEAPGPDDCDEHLVAKSTGKERGKDQGKIIGWISYGHSRDNDADAGTTAEIWGLYCDPSEWGRGAGRAMTEAAIYRLAEPLGYKIVTLWALGRNFRARHFYEKLGFVHDTTDANNIKTVNIGGAEVEEVRYHRSIGKSGA